MLFQDQWGPSLDPIALRSGLFEAVQCLKDGGPIVALEVVVNFVDIKFHCSFPLGGEKFTPI